MKHCFHGTGLVLTSEPPQYPEVCCYCGKGRTVRGRLYSSPGHGRFIPSPVEGIGSARLARRQAARAKGAITFEKPFEDEECPERKE